MYTNKDVIPRRLEAEGLSLIHLWCHLCTWLSLNDAEVTFCQNRSAIVVEAFPSLRTYVAHTPAKSKVKKKTPNIEQEEGWERSQRRSMHVQMF
jgi:hypothetical protein